MASICSNIGSQVAIHKSSVSMAEKQMMQKQVKMVMQGEKEQNTPVQTIA